MQQQRVLVTGGAGFIGSHLCEALLADGHQVTCLDNFSTGSMDNIRHLSLTNVMEGDINSQATFSQLKELRFDVVFHYAATVGVLKTEEEPLAVLDDVVGMRHLAQLAQMGMVGQIIFASSSEVYGDPNRLPEKESHGVIGWSPYTAVKLYGEYLFSSVWKEYKVPTTSLRFFNVYGPRQRGSSYGFVTARFIEQVQSGESPTVFGDGSQTRDFVYVDDNVKAALVAMGRPEAYGEVINVGSGQETAVVDLAQTIIAAFGRNDLEPAFLPGRAVEISRRRASIAKMKGVLGFSPRVVLEDGIALTVSQQDQAYSVETAS